MSLVASPRWWQARGSMPRRWAAPPLVVVVVAALLLHAPAVAVVAILVLGVLAVTSPQRAHAAWPVDALAWLPVGAVAALGAALVVLVPSSALGIRAVTSDLTWLVVAGVLAAWAWGRGGRIGIWSPLSLLAWLPAAIVGVALGYRLLQPMSYWSRPFWSLTDPMNHAWMVVETGRAGRISYAAGDLLAPTHTIYPRGLHAVLAAVVAAMEPGDSVLDWWRPTLLVVMVALTVAAVLAIASTCLLAVQLTRRVGAGAASAVTAVAVTGLLLLHPETFDVLFSDGFLTSVSASVVLAALLLALDQRGRSAPAVRLVIALGGAACTFLLWQLLAGPVLLLAGWLTWRWWRSGHRHPWAVVGSAVVAGLLVAPLAVSTFGAAGVAQASTPAAVTPASMAITVVVLVLAALLVVTTRVRSTALGQGGAVLVGSVVLVAVLINALSGGSVGDWTYYASKTLWHAMTLALPAAVVMVVVGVPRIWRWPRLVAVLPSGLVRGTVVGAVLALGLTVVAGRLSDGLNGNVRSLADAGGVSVQVPFVAVDDPVIAAEPGRPVVPYLLHPQGWQLWLRFDDWNAAVMLGSAGHPVPPASALLARQVVALCDWLRAHPDALRVTGPRRGDEELVRRGCPASVVRPGEWRVLVTPPGWWADTPWASTGGAPDPSLPQPDYVLPSANR